MTYFMQTDLSFFTAIVLLLLLFGQAANYDRSLLSHRLYRGMVFLTFCVLMLDTIGWTLEGMATPGLIVLNWITSTLGCVTGPVISLLWYLYAHNHVLGDNRRTLREGAILAIPVLLYSGFALFSPLHRLLFMIDADNHFHRGPLFGLIAMLMIGYLLAAFALLILLRKKINHRDFLPLTTFMLPPFAFGVLQLFFFGVTLVWSGMTISLLILHLYLQHHSLRTDYLTGLFNRRQLDKHLRGRIEAWSPGTVLGALMLDVDNFKDINDAHGHVQGDDALEEIANILKKSFHSKDFIARYAGDEFVVVLVGSESIDFLAIRARVRENLNRLNHSGDKPYQLSVSIGCAIFDPVRHKNADQFLHHVDMRMYHEKRAKKQTAAREASLTTATDPAGNPVANDSPPVRECPG